MKLTQIAGALLAVLVITGSAAALPAAAGAQAEDTTVSETNQTEQGPPADAGPNGDAGPPADAGPNGDAGPPADLPGQVPAFVGEIHDLIHQQQNGSLDGNLGERISDVTPENESADDESDDSESDTESTDDTDASDDESDDTESADDEDATEDDEEEAEDDEEMTDDDETETEA